MKKIIKEMFNEQNNLNQDIYTSLTDDIEKAVNLIIECMKNNNKILLAANGGSATQCDHIEAEFVGRFKKERKALPAISLCSNIANLTAIGNDYGFEKIFERQVEAQGVENDILIGISTSGNSENVIKAIEKAKQKGMKTIVLLGRDGGKTKDMSDVEIIIPSQNTPRIQEAHITILHMICELVENELFKEE